MALFKCKMCGGSLELNGSETVATCEYCGTQQTLPRLDNDRRANLYDRANHFRRNNEFDRAMGIYDQILADDKTDAEAYWSLVLCRYGIEYVEDPVTRRRIPTVNRAQFVSVFDDDNYKSALQYADGLQKSIYENEAQSIDNIQKGILAISQKEEPFDVFICYKETDAAGRRTMDSVLAQDLYTQLTQNGFKVFFSRITLEDKLGSAYEPYIFAALNSAKVMVVVGTKPEYFNAVWVRNEWSRYLNLIRQGQKKTLIPAYRDMDPYDLPEEFSHLQAQDMSKLGFMQDLTRGIAKIVQADKPAVEVKVTAAQANAGALVKRAAIFLEDRNTDRATEYCEKALDVDPECADAYVILLMIDMGVTSRDQLKDCEAPFDDNHNYQRSLRFGDDALKAELTGCIEHINVRNEQARIEGIYSSAVNKMSSAWLEKNLIQLAEQFESIAQYKDSAELALKCREKAEDAKKNAILNEGKAQMAGRSKTIENYESAIKLFRSIPGWMDADEQIVICEEKIAELEAKAEADRQLQAQLAEIARQEAAKRAKRIKLVSLISMAVIAVGIACVILWINVLSPMLQYNKAMDLMESGSYDEAIAIFTQLDDYKDSVQKIPEAHYAKGEKLFADKQFDEAIAVFQGLGSYTDAADRVLEVTYAKAGALFEAGEYPQAAEIYKALEDYSDSATKYCDTILAYATALVEEKNLSEAEAQLRFLTNKESHANGVDKLYVAITDAYYADEKYEEALATYGHTNDFSTNSDKYKDMTYKLAELRFNEKRYDVAKTTFAKISGYLDADQRALESDYQLALSKMSSKEYGSAVLAFSRVLEYKDSKERIKEAKYLYIKANLDRTDNVTHTYLKDLKAAKYKDSADIFKELYAWKVKFVVNDDEENETTNMTSISKYSNWYFHISLSGGEPGASVQLRYTGYFPDGSTNSDKWDEKWEDGWGGYCSFWYNNPAYGKQGTFRVKVFDDKGNLLGEQTVKITG